MKIELIALKEIIPYEHNAKKHPRYQLEQLKRSIQEFGNNDPIAIDEKNVIIEGYGRYLALKELGHHQVPVIRLLHLSEEAKRAYILAHNKITMNTDFDLQILKQELTTIIHIDMTDFGFSSNFLSAPLVDQKKEESVREEERVSIEEGSLYQLGKHRLMCGDSTNPKHLEKLLAGQTVDLYLTDPPYNVAYEGKTKEALTIKNDQMASEAFQSFLSSAFSAIDVYLKAGGVFYIWHADRERLSFSKAIERAGWEVKQTLIWVKNHFVIGRQDYQWQHEPCLYGWKKGGKHYFVGDYTLSTVLDSQEQLEGLSKAELIALLMTYQNKEPTTILREKKPERNAEHPTMKPLALLERLVRNSSRQGEVVLDTFAGSGSTLLVCERLKRVNYSMELDPKYVSRIIKRWEEETGLKAKKLD